MGELEPDDSRDVTLTDNQAPGEPPRTGPREGETRGEGKPRADGTDAEEPSETGRSWRDTENERQRDEGDTTSDRKTKEDAARNPGSF